MNWFKEWHGLEATNMHSSLKRRGGAYDEDECAHVTDGAAVVLVASERDSSGPLSYYSMCDDCAKQHRDAERKDLHLCDFCGEAFAREDGRLWKPYDFYAPQGDEVTPICRACWLGNEEVRKMVADDRRSYNAYMGGDDQDD